MKVAIGVSFLILGACLSGCQHGFSLCDQQAATYAARNHRHFPSRIYEHGEAVEVIDKGRTWEVRFFSVLRPGDDEPIDDVDYFWVSQRTCRVARSAIYH